MQKGRPRLEDIRSRKNFPPVVIVSSLNSRSKDHSRQKESRAFHANFQGPSLSSGQSGSGIALGFFLLMTQICVYARKLELNTPVNTQGQKPLKI